LVWACRCPVGFPSQVQQEKTTHQPESIDEPQRRIGKNKQEKATIGPSEKRGAKAAGRVRFQPARRDWEKRNAWNGPGLKAAYNPSRMPWVRFIMVSYLIDVSIAQFRNFWENRPSQPF
jgi:hypothetical protein